MRPALFVAALVALRGARAAAQAWEVWRRVLTFIGTRIEIHVETRSSASGSTMARASRRLAALRLLPHYS